MPKKDLKVLEAAIKMEKDGRDFYLKSSKSARNAVAKRLLASLADEELRHIDRINEIYEGLKEDKDWADFGKAISKAAKAKLGIVFRPLSGAGKKRLRADPSNLEALKISMRKEKDSYDYYDRQSKDAGARVAKVFYGVLMKEEERHYELLEQAYSLLSDPASWFVQQEGRTMEG